jgi:hypothetical protein
MLDHERHGRVGLTEEKQTESSGYRVRVQEYRHHGGVDAASPWSIKPYKAGCNVLCSSCRV